jgi:hypothetical protein
MPDLRIGERTLSFLTNKELQAALAKLPDDLIVGDDYAEGFATGAEMMSYTDETGKHDYVGINFEEPDDEDDEDDGVEEEIVEDGEDDGVESETL